MSRTLSLLLLLVLVPASAPARENTGAGVSLGLGFAASDPAPGPAFLVDLPSLEIAVGLDDAATWQLRARWHAIKTVWAAALERQLEVQVDVTALALLCQCPVGQHAIRPIVGPTLGFLIQAIPVAESVQPGVHVGGRFGAEYVGPQRRLGVTLAAEPYFVYQGGPAGPGRTNHRVGGGAQLVLGITGYQAPRGVSP